MAKEFWVKKNNFGNLVPYGRHDETIIAKLPVNKRLKAKITQPRNAPHNSKYWVMLQMVIDNQRFDYFPSAEVLHGALKQKLGYTAEYKFKDGSSYHHQASTAFDAMDQQEFNLYYTQAVDLICTQVAPNLNPESLLKELEGF